jgi:CHAT domain-containing protein
VSELRDYFRDPCLGALSRGIETLSRDTAVLYPVLLPDRLVLLLEAGGKLIQKVSPVQKDRLNRLSMEFAHALRRGLAFNEPARQLYNILIRPVSPVLEQHKIKTLVHVPGGVLRLLPLAALMDGDTFLVEKYALVTAPGLTLLDPAPFQEEGKKSLVAGLSEPGPVIYDLPSGVWQALGDQSRSGIKTTIRGLALEVVSTTDPAGGDIPGPASEKQGQQVRNALALPGVEHEVKALSGRLDAKVLFNDTFRLEDFSMELKARPYSIIHIASHGFFGGTPDQNFIMTYDRRLDMNDLESLIRPRQLADHPVELIALSACQTAEGDDKSPLGLAGVVLKSGARSALGSLWPVSDQASQEIFPLFYSFLENKGQETSTKARALQMAQMTLMNKENFRHPFYWAPFILVGNWL